VLVLAACNVQSSQSERVSYTESAMSQAKGCEQLAENTSGATFVMLNTQSSRLLVCNPIRAQMPYLPASTFKVPHALIALATGVADGPEHRIAWDGKTRAVPAWNQATTLTTGITHSTVWYYQHIAREVGFQRMQQWVDALEFGNSNIGSIEDQRFRAGDILG